MTLSKLTAALIADAALSLSATAIGADDHKGHNHDDKKGAEHAHDTTPTYGGVVSVVKDVNYELVPKPDSITLYVTKTDVKLVPAGDNKLQAQGAFKVQPGPRQSLR
jgi:hypothetical protein